MPDNLSSAAPDYGSEADKQAEPETEHNPGDFTNPYARTADNYSDESETDETEDEYSPENGYSPESGYSDSSENGNTQWY